jgi:hypothetical protein
MPGPKTALVLPRVQVTLLLVALEVVLPVLQLSVVEEEVEEVEVDDDELEDLVVVLVVVVETLTIVSFASRTVWAPDRLSDRNSSAVAPTSSLTVTASPCSGIRGPAVGNGALSSEWTGWPSNT